MSKALRDEYPLPYREKIQELVEGLAGDLEPLVHEFYARMRDDVMIGFFFNGFDVGHVAEMQIEFIKKSAGLKNEFNSKGGRTPDRAHDKLPPILPGFFHRRLTILESLLREKGVKDEYRETWVALENAFRSRIVTLSK